MNIDSPVVWEVLQYVWPNQFETVAMSGGVVWNWSSYAVNINPWSIDFWYTDDDNYVLNWWDWWSSVQPCRWNFSWYWPSVSLWTWNMRWTAVFWNNVYAKWATSWSVISKWSKNTDLSNIANRNVFYPIDVALWTTDRLCWVDNSWKLYFVQSWFNNIKVYVDNWSWLVFDSDIDISSISSFVNNISNFKFSNNKYAMHNSSTNITRILDSWLNVLDIFYNTVWWWLRIINRKVYINTTTSDHSFRNIYVM